MQGGNAVSRPQKSLYHKLIGVVRSRTDKLIATPQLPWLRRER